MQTLKDLRKERKMTQEQAASMMGVSLRSYKSYENDSVKEGTLKYNYFLDKIRDYCPIDESNGVLSIQEISDSCKDIFNKYQVDFCYLFGSYAKNIATPVSDVDLLISTSVTGLQYFSMVEELREALHKKVDALDLKQLDHNMDLVYEVLKDGIKIYG